MLLLSPTENCNRLSENRMQRKVSISQVNGSASKPVIKPDLLGHSIGEVSVKAVSVLERRIGEMIGPNGLVFVERDIFLNSMLCIN